MGMRRMTDGRRGRDAGRMDLEFVVIYTGAALLLGGLAFMWVRVGPNSSADGGSPPADQPTTTVVVLAGTVADTGSGKGSDEPSSHARRVLVVGAKDKARANGPAQWEWQCPNGHVLTKQERNRSTDADPGAHTRPECL